MKIFYKIFIVLFILFIGASLYAIDYEIGFFHEENTSLVLSLSAGIVGLLLVFVLNAWSSIGKKK